MGEEVSKLPVNYSGLTSRLFGVVVVAGVGHPSPSDGVDGRWRRRWVVTRADGLGCRGKEGTKKTF